MSGVLSTFAEACRRPFSNGTEGNAWMAKWCSHCGAGAMMPAPRSCLRWDGHGYELACVDDLCHGSDRTLCGLERYVDFDVEADEIYDDEVWP